MDTNTNTNAQELLSECSELQSRFWEVLSKLEEALGVDIDSTCDLENQTVDSLLEADYDDTI
jgi:hypothetical protein